MTDRQIETFTKSVRWIIQYYFPDLAGPYHHPVKAKVIKVRGSGADLQLLDKDGKPSSSPLLPAVPYPGGMILEAGDKVRVSFYYNEPAQAFIEAKI